MPNLVAVKNTLQYDKAVVFFEKVIQYKRSEYNFSEDHLKLAENCLKWIDKAENEVAYIRAKYYLFHYYNNQFNIPETISRAKELLTFNRFFEMKEVVFVLYVLKTAYYNSKQFEELIKILPQYYNQRGIYGHPFDGQNNKNFNANEAVNSAYAKIYFQLKNYKQAQVHFKKQLKYLESIQEFYSIASCQNNIGISFFYGRKYDSSMYYFDKALQTINTKVIEKEKVSSEYLNHFKNSINANKAAIYIKDKEYDKALPFEYAVLKSSRETKETHLELSANYDLAQIFYYKNNNNSSLKHIDNIFSILKNYKSDQLKIKALNLKAKNFMLQGKIKEANSFFEIQQNLVDSLEQEEINKKHLQATVKLDVSNISNQLKESKVELKEKSKVGLYQKIGIALLAMMLVVLFFVYKTNKKKSDIIEKQKLLAYKSLQQREILLKEVHHRVKNNLHQISGLLNLQFQKHKHLGISEMVNDLQKHISSIAFAHEILYQEEDLSTIKMQKYLEELGRRLLQVTIRKEIKYETKIDKISLPINYATTIGLILNELITNSLKYAFPENKGTITIQLLKDKEQQYQFIYKDNGVGMDVNLFYKSSDSLGLKLIKMFSDEIDATLNVKSENGVSYTFMFNVKTQLN
ncbi:sensor histidine kinase [uncultured Polaribacter sp.]|uniref:sensor histidine kinase n=1 Tax=uncultured Polaribacter sp. TaxID=174711 RepID=UPI002617EBFB|nr:sensor histidine kinase [uncultured Polaribacter sp.]